MSPSSCSSDQLLTAGSELQRDARLPFFRGKTFARLCLKFYQTRSSKQTASRFPTSAIFLGSKAGGGGAELVQSRDHGIGWSSRVLVPG